MGNKWVLHSWLKPTQSDTISYQAWSHLHNSVCSHSSSDMKPRMQSLHWYTLLFARDKCASIILCNPRHKCWMKHCTRKDKNHSSFLHKNNTRIGLPHLFLQLIEAYGISNWSPNLNKNLGSIGPFNLFALDKRHLTIWQSVTLLSTAAFAIRLSPFNFSSCRQVVGKKLVNGFRYPAGTVGASSVPPSTPNCGCGRIQRVQL